MVFKTLFISKTNLVFSPLASLATDHFLCIISTALQSCSLGCWRRSCLKDWRGDVGSWIQLPHPPAWSACLLDSQNCRNYCDWKVSYLQKKFLLHSGFSLQTTLREKIALMPVCKHKASYSKTTNLYSFIMSEFVGKESIFGEICTFI